MRPITTITAAIALAITIISCSPEKPHGGSGGDQTPSYIPTGLCPGGDSTKFCPTIPNDITIALFPGYNDLDSTHQPYFDQLSWQEFVALNWPANADGTPNDTSTIGNVSGPRVWEYYTDPIEFFQLPIATVPGYEKGFPPGTKVLRMMAKNLSFSDTSSIFVQSTGSPLIDRNLNFTMFEMRMNPDEVAYIRANGLQTEQGQVGKTIDFPAGVIGKNVGAIEMKAAWRIMVPGKDDTTRFYCRPAIISIPPANTVNGKPLVAQVTVGLVGLHIAHKTTNGRGWIWTTFEHVDNAPNFAFGPDFPDPITYSYYNPLGAFMAPINTPPDTLPGDGGNFKWDTVQPYAARYAYSSQLNGNTYLVGSQIVRLFPIYGPTEAMNNYWRGKLKGTVWANYKLIASQWSNAVGAARDTSRKNVGTGSPTPAIPTFLANAAMESFIQPNGSCTSCHKGATDAAGEASDFSFLLGLANSGLQVAAAPIPSHGH
jgi:hypothetical protein